MAETSDKGIWLSYEGVEEIAQQTWQIISTFFRPLLSPLIEIMGEGTTGFFIVAALFFLIWLVRQVASTHAPDVFANGLRGIGGWGLDVSVLYLLIFGLERTLLPVLGALTVILGSEVIGDGPNIETLMMALSTHAGQEALAKAVFSSVQRSGTELPLSVWSATLIAGAFACMYLVGSLLSRNGRST